VPAVHERIARSYALNQELMGRGMPIYGVTTGSVIRSTATLASTGRRGFRAT
jgi:histidine ammonia-lyase